MRKTSKVRQTQTHGCLVFGFFCIFAAAGLAAGYFLTWKPLSGIVAARNWVETDCAVVSSDVEANQGSDSTTYRVDIVYTYDVDWQTFQGDRYDFSIGSSSGYEGKAKVVEAHPPGSEVSCYYDPNDPSTSVINREPGSYLWWGLFPVPFLAVGLGGLIGVAFARKNRRPSKTEQATGRGHDQHGVRQHGVRQHGASQHGASQHGKASNRYGLHNVQDRTRDRAQTLGGTLELKAQASPTTKVIGTLIIAIFWNGIVSLFLFGDFIHGSGGFAWLPILFLTPFVLVGIGLIGLFFYMVLAWFNPRPRLTLAEGHLAPGSKTTLSWQFDGRAGRLRQLTIKLEGLEEVRYRRGTDTQTDTYVFFSQTLVTADRLALIHRGRTELNVPERTMPTFEANNNKIKWRLTIHGEIPQWPDVDENFSIVVSPS